MTALGDSSLPRPKPEASKDEKANGTGGSLAATIRQLFREAKAALTGITPDPQPPARRRDGEDTGRAAFTMAAGKLLRRAVRIPAEAYATATTYLADTLDWLNLWHHETDSGDEFNEDQHSTPIHLYPHL